MLLIIEEIKHAEIMANVSPCPTCHERKRCDSPECLQNAPAPPGFHWQIYCGPDGIEYLRGHAATVQAAFADAMQQAADVLSLYD